MRLHQRLEEQLAAFKHTEAALLFNSGYHANIGVLGALVGEGDAVFSDALNHASIIDGCHLSRAQVVIYPHRDVDNLATQLAHSTARRRLIVTESIFSMDGDTAPLGAVCEVAERYGAMVMVDEAHATGVVGPRGAGVVAQEGLQDRVTVQMGTLGKGLGAFGAFVAARRCIIDLLINNARSFIYTTALPPAVVAAAAAALAIVMTDERRRRGLAKNAAQLHRELKQLGLQLGPGASHIIPVLIGDARRTLRLSDRLFAEGVFVQAIRPPTVPSGTARLRITAMSTHTVCDLCVAREAFRRVLEEEW
jgi:8-amino-7-oxononanoate synthase